MARELQRVVAVVGGGLAGIAAAVRLAAAGDRPVVIETRRKLGGRATSFVDPRSGAVLDNCQHVLMGCCTNLLDLYARLGVADKIEWHRAIHWANPPAEPDRMRPGLLPAPGHYTGSFLRMRFLSMAEKAAIARAMWRLLRIGLHGRTAWRGRVFMEFLEETRQPPRAIERFWSPVVVSACNLPVERVAADCAMQVFQEGFLGSRRAGAMGLAAVPLVELYDPAERLIAETGGEIRTGLSAKSLAYDGARITGVVTDEGFVSASAVVSAVPPDRLDKLVSAPLRGADNRLERLSAIEFSPILGVHLFFEQRVLDLPHLVLTGRDTQWMFNKGIDPEGRQHLHAVISGADDWMALAEDAIVERVMADLHACVPRSIGLAPVAFRAVKEKRATFAALPGIERLRPSAEPGTLGLRGGGVRNLFLAGDWCDTGWPATMEGAVRSGYAAASAFLGAGGPVPDLPVSRFSRLLGLR